MTGTDGHHALLSWAEIDPDFGRAPVLLAVTIDATPLDGAGPRLVLAQDRCGARHISGINAMRVDEISLPEAIQVTTFGPWRMTNPRVRHGCWTPRRRPCGSSRTSRSAG